MIQITNCHFNFSSMLFGIMVMAEVSKMRLLLIEDAPELSFAVVIISSPDMVSGETYTITVGATSGEFEAY